MKSPKGLKIKIGVGLLLVLIGSIGCARLRPIIFHPIDQEDFKEMKAGESYTPDRDGYFLSEYYLDEISKARVE